MKCLSPCWHLVSGILLLALVGCTSRGPDVMETEPAPPIPPAKWQEIQEEIWTASTLAHLEAQYFAREAMREWMTRVREETRAEFVPWYTGYWAQQWIGVKVGWYRMNRNEDDPPVEDYLVEYIQQRFHELVLEPAGELSDPRTITKDTAAQYVRLLSTQLRRIPQTHAIPLSSLRHRLKVIPLITLTDSDPDAIPLSFLLESSELAGVPAYKALLAHSDSIKNQENSSPGKEPLQIVAKETVARLVADLPVRAGGGAAALLVGESLGLIISAGVTAWSISSHEQKRPEIESRLRNALATGLDQLWERLMTDPELGVMSPVNHMREQVDIGLFPVLEPGAEMRFQPAL